MGAEHRVKSALPDALREAADAEVQKAPRAVTGLEHAAVPLTAGVSGFKELRRVPVDTGVELRDHAGAAGREEGERIRDFAGMPCVLKGLPQCGGDGIVSAAVVGTQDQNVHVALLSRRSIFCSIRHRRGRW